MEVSVEEGDISTDVGGIPFGNESISTLYLELLKQGFNFTTQTLKNATREPVLAEGGLSLRTLIWEHSRLCAMKL